jgi:uncharacterized phage protein gp47/JayE
MGLDATGWTPTSAGDVIAELRAGFDAAAGQPLDYSAGTWEGGATVAYGVMAARVEADAAVILDALSPETAAGGNLDRIGAFRGIPRRGATRSRYVAYPVILAGYPSVVVPAGTQVRDTDRQVWQTVATQTVTSASDEIAIEAYDTGPVALDDGAAQTLQSVTPVAGLSAMTYDPGDGDPFSLGRAQETDAEYRVRLRRSLSLSGGSSSPGVRTTVLALPWVAAVDVVRTAPGTVTVYVIPAPVGADQTAALAEAIGLLSVAAGIATDGSDSADITLPGGVVDTVFWTPGAEVPVTVAYALTLASGTSLASVYTAVQNAAEATIAAATRGQRLTVLSMLAAVAPISGITGASVLLNGSAADVVVTSTELVTLSGSVVVA